MLPSCLRLADDVFPRVKAEASRRLVGAGWSQTRTAAALGVSQAMVSKYQGRPEEDPLVLRLASDLVRDVEAPHPGPTWCGTLAALRPEGDDALRDLLAAEAMLRGAVHIAPEIGLNIARATPQAREPKEVLAFPGRIVSAGDRLVAPVPPAFGGSGHLARCLLALRARDPNILALASARGDASTMRAVSQEVVELSSEGDVETRFQEAVRRSREVPRLLRDPGAHGIEPCLYVAGPDARAVAKTLLTLDQDVRP